MIFDRLDVIVFNETDFAIPNPASFVSRLDLSNVSRAFSGVHLQNVCLSILVLRFIIKLRFPIKILTLPWYIIVCHATGAVSHFTVMVVNTLCNI